MASQDEIDVAKTLLESVGYVVLKEKSYRAAQERQHLAQAEVNYAYQRIADTREWANKAYDEQRRLADRITFVYGEARAAGVPREKLVGPIERPAALESTVGTLKVYQPLQQPQVQPYTALPELL